MPDNIKYDFITPDTIEIGTIQEKILRVQNLIDRLID